MNLPKKLFYTTGIYFQNYLISIIRSPYFYSFLTGFCLITLMYNLLLHPTLVKPKQTSTSYSFYSDSLKETSLENRMKNHCSFRGAMGSGISASNNLPVEWDLETEKNLIWKVPLPMTGFNSPVIWEDKIFLSCSDLTEKAIYCFDRYSGKQLWNKKVAGIENSPEDFTARGIIFGLSLPTLTTNGQHVYGIFASGDLICLDMEGKELWSRNLGVPDNQYGHGSSLIWWGNKLYVQYDTNNSGHLYAIHMLTGELIWKKERDNAASAWSSPLIASINDEYQLVLSTTPFVAGYDLQNGNELWRVNCMSGELATSPGAGENLIFSGNEYAKLVAIDPNDPAKIIWEHFDHLPEAASPVCFEGLLYIATRTGFIVCFNAKTGEKYWEYESDEGFFSSPIIADNKMYVSDFSGTTHIFETSKEMNLLYKSSINEKVVSTPAFADGHIYIRSFQHLYCFGYE